MPNFHSQLQSLLHDLRTPGLAAFRQRSQELKEKNSPRNKFVRWRNSDEGKDWKQKEFERVKGRCQCCQKSFSSANLVIDHIQPLARFPELATDIKNFQLLCHACNSTKGVRECAQSPRRIGNNE